MKRIAFILFASCRLLLTAQSTSWTGAADTTWHNAANWTSGIPSQTVDAIIGDVNFTGNNEPTINASASCRDLVINLGRTLTVVTSNEMQVAGSLVNDGMISSDSLNINFVGTCTLDGNGTATYTTFKVAAGANITLNKPVVIRGDFTVDGTFSAGGNTITFSGTSAAAVRGTGTISLANVVLNKPGASLTLQAPATITGSLTLADGILYTTSANLLTLADDATASSGNAGSYVDGPMKKVGNDAFVFPLGNDGVWARLGISAPALATDAFTAQYFAAPYSNTDSLSNVAPLLTHVSKVEYWSCDRTSGNSAVNVELYWEDNARSGISDYTDLAVAHWNGTDWEYAGQVSVTAGTQGSILSASQNAFSPFTFGSSGGLNVLPITLENFRASLNNSMQVELNWETVTEINNSHFAVERSVNGAGFEPIAVLKGAGNSTVKRTYSALDQQPADGISYYRLKQVDNNGAFTYSAIRTLEIKKAVADMEVYPNPGNGHSFAISFREEAGAEVQVAVCNQMGGKVYERIITNDAQVSLISVELDYPLSPGVYSLFVTDGSSVYKKKLIIR